MANNSYYKNYYDNSSVKSKIKTIGNQLSNISNNIKKLKNDLSGLDNRDYVKVSEDLEYIEEFVTHLDMVRVFTNDAFINRAEYFDSVCDYYAVGSTFSYTEFFKYDLSDIFDDCIPFSPLDEDEKGYVLDDSGYKIIGMIINPGAGNEAVIKYVRTAKYHYPNDNGEIIYESRNSEVRKRTILF